jgi:hypothetical protein
VLVRPDGPLEETVPAGRDLHAFARMLLRGGAPVLSPESARAMGTDQLTDAVKAWGGLGPDFFEGRSWSFCRDAAGVGEPGPAPGAPRDPGRRVRGAGLISFRDMSVSTALRSVAAIRYVMPLREGGSLPGLVEAADDGLYVIKFRGAGQGLRALVAEVIVGELARRLGLLVPELVELELDPVLGAAEPDPEIQQLITDSGGSNLGVDFLPGALPYTPAGRLRPDARLAADIVWLDALTTNVDRTPRNPNLLIWHDRLWLIDHGAALYLQHGGLDPVSHSARAFPLIGQHVLLPCAGSIAEAHERLAPVVDRVMLEEVVGLVPVEWFADADPPDAYVEYLSRRLVSGAFASEAERARAVA